MRSLVTMAAISAALSVSGSANAPIHRKTRRREMALSYGLGAGANSSKSKYSPHYGKQAAERNRNRFLN